MFKINDYIIYGGNGVCRVLDIGIPAINIGDSKRKYYTLQQVYKNGSVIYTPVDNDRVVMRKLISKEEAKELTRNLDSIEILLIDDDKMLEERYKEVMNKYDCTEMIKIIKTSYSRTKERLEQGKKNTMIDDKYLKIAEENLFGELAITLNRTKEQIKDFIDQQVRKPYNLEEGV
ncbi:CarD family transcriptional regulator [Clostridium cellulovorans]|uniref:Transcription factor CarD n=1 Tax=Clostridium cellulovorans (strain ATCC 35296 / DSM 3052 / OCM 3 / 743B) TaxID=573061 RepID=D9SUG1_CLOC7|nr:CarD family transcriptional regulator [Clostridium cellulovorans]ADL52916.1 transcription factor CarD [Clostridium cellulovorans 743B]